MIPQDITDYLHTHRVDWQQRQHRLAVTAEELAATLHVTARRVAKSVLVQVDAQVFIAVLPATEVIDEDRLASVLGATIVRVMREWEFEELFPECEPGAEPPFGGLYGLPVVVDSALADEEGSSSVRVRTSRRSRCGTRTSIGSRKSPGWPPSDGRAATARRPGAIGDRPRPPAEEIQGHHT